MLFTITGKHIDITEAIRKHAEERTSKLPKYYDNINQVEVIIDGSQSGNTSVEIIARGEHSKLFVVTETGEDAYRCIDLAVHKLERQLRRKKGKERDNKHTGGVEQNIKAEEHGNAGYL
ncbi:MAG TPA: ribosome-associated translation inhibitor RaiA [Planctomycetes bacterium]|nr:ribosome-associated translation inhibitor RaiA [Planctomycetota bacterium]